MRYSKLYASESGTILAVEECEAAWVLVENIRLPRQMFEGRPIPAHVAQAYLNEYGGKWIQADGVHAFEANPVKKPKPASDGTLEPTITMNWKRP